jgi:hypothetical protein
MADGSIIDGRGIAPQIAVKNDSTSGNRDVMLEKAIMVITK